MASPRNNSRSPGTAERDDPEVELWTDGSPSDAASRAGLLERAARLSTTRPRTVLAVIGALSVVFLVVGIPGVGRLLPGGYQDPASESALATRVLAEQFGQGDMQLYLLVRDDSGEQGSGALRDAGIRLVDRLQSLPTVAQVQSPWTTAKPTSAAMISDDGRSALIVAGIAGGEIHAQSNASRIADGVSGTADGITVVAGGPAMIYAQITRQAQVDLVTAELVAVPLTFAVLIWVFGGLVAATLPLVVGAFSIAGTLFILRVYSHITDVSIFALNLTTALGFALAIDYTLLLISRYREERLAGRSAEVSMIRTMTTAGRTVIFSAITVGVSMMALAFFPMFFLRSFAYAGTAVVFFAAIAALALAPALMFVLDDRLDKADVRRGVRRLLGRPEPAAQPPHRRFWYRWAKLVMSRRIAFGLIATTSLVILGIPFAHAQLSYPDDRVLAPSLSARQVGDHIRAEFPDLGESNLTVVVTDPSSLTDDDLGTYVRSLSEIDGVDAVAAPNGTYVRGQLSGPPIALAAHSGTATALTIVTRPDMGGPALEQLLTDVRDVAHPGEAGVLVTGVPQVNRDSVDAITNRLPLVLGFIAISSALLLILVTGSLVLPLKALLLNVLSLSAVFGVVVWVFQDGHLGGLGTAVTGSITFNMPMLLFCVAFGLSMDYEVFVVARIREHWLASDRTAEGNAEAVALGLASTGRVVTAAAVVMSIVFSALILSKTAFMTMVGFGLAFAVLLDATVVRATLVPALMSVAGRFNWWAPRPMRRRLDRVAALESG